MKTVALADVAHVNPRPEKVDPDATVSFVGMAELDDVTALARPRVERPFAEVSKGYTVFRDGDILAAKITPCWENGKVGQAALDHAIGVGSTEFHVLRPGPHVHDRYLLHFLRQASVRQTGTIRMTGSGGQRRVPTRFLESLELPLPSLEEQRRIAAILDKADAIRAKRRQILAHLDDLTQSVFHDMFGHERAVTTVEKIAVKTRTGPFGSQLLHSEFVDEGIAVLGLDNVVGNEFRWGERRYITSEKYEQLKGYTVQPADVLISIMGTTGRCVVVPDDIPIAINTKHICAISPDPALADSAFLRAAFLWHPESRAHLRRQTKGSIMDGLNMGIIKAMPVPLPAIEVQREFSARLAAVNSSKSRAEVVQKSDDRLFASLQSRAFRGEL